MTAMIDRLLTLCLLLLLPFAAFAEDLSRPPEAATGTKTHPLVLASRHMVAAAHPLAAEAGRDILRQGGSAVDAAIATQLVLGLVEPQSSGLGGGTFVVVYSAGQKSTATYDGRETAPAAAAPGRFLRDGQPIEFDTAVQSGLSTGVPGTLRVLELAHKRHGKLPWPALFQPAIKLAEEGFPVSDRLHQLLALEGADAFASDARRYFYDEAGQAIAAGTLLKNPQYAATLKAVANGGADAFYSGAVADAIVAALAGAPNFRGDMTADDLKAYAAVEREAVCFVYRMRKICGMGPPSSGAIAIGQTLKLIEPFDQVQGPQAAMTSVAVNIIAEAEKLAFADRNRYVADPDVIPVPSGLLDAAYLDERRKLIGPLKAMPPPEAGVPPGLGKRTFGVDTTREAAGTSHVSIVDDEGNAVAMTTTIESAFGSHQWAAGFLLNNELTDFSFKPTDEAGTAVANAVGPGKRPRSSMAPTLVFSPSGELEVVTGSPGGSHIIAYVVKTLVALLDWNSDAAQSAALPNFGSEGKALFIDDSPGTALLALQLKGYGQTVSAGLLTSGVHTIVRRGGRLEGGADPRREGTALGD